MLPDHVARQGDRHLLRGPGKHGCIHHEKFAARGDGARRPSDDIHFADCEIGNGISEFDVVDGLRGCPLGLVCGRHTGLPFPAAAEIVLEGFVEPETTVPEGPFGDWTGTYTEPAVFAR